MPRHEGRRSTRPTRPGPRAASPSVQTTRGQRSSSTSADTLSRRCNGLASREDIVRFGASTRQAMPLTTGSRSLGTAFDRHDVSSGDLNGVRCSCPAKAATPYARVAHSERRRDRGREIQRALVESGLHRPPAASRLRQSARVRPRPLRCDDGRCVGAVGLQNGGLQNGRNEAMEVAIEAAIRRRRDRRHRPDLPRNDQSDRRQCGDGTAHCASAPARRSVGHASSCSSIRRRSTSPVPRACLIS